MFEEFLLWSRLRVTGVKTLRAPRTSAKQKHDCLTVRDQEIRKRRYLDWLNKEPDGVTEVNVHTCCNRLNAHLMVQQLFSSVSMYHRSHLGQRFPVQTEIWFFSHTIILKNTETGSCKVASLIGRSWIITGAANGLTHFDFRRLTAHLIIASFLQENLLL